MFSYLQKTLFGTEETTNSIESTDDIVIMEHPNNHENDTANNAEQEHSHFIVGDDGEHNEGGDEFIQENTHKKPDYIMAIGDKRKRLRYLIIDKIVNIFTFIH